MMICVQCCPYDVTVIFDDSKSMLVHTAILYIDSIFTFFLNLTDYIALFFDSDPIAHIWQGS